MKKETNKTMCPVEMNVCCKDYSCLTCYWFDGSYRYGWCNYWEQETLPAKTCNNHK